MVSEGWATESTIGVTVYAVVGEPPSNGASHDTVTAPPTSVACTLVGAAGGVGAPAAAGLSTSVAANQVVPAPVFMLAAGLAPAATMASSVSSSMSEGGDRWVRTV